MLRLAQKTSSEQNCGLQYVFNTHIERYPANNPGWLENKCGCNVWLTYPVTLTFADYTCPELYPTILCAV